jgi:hypothetical protein
MKAFVKALVAEVVRQGAVTFATTVATEVGTVWVKRLEKRRKCPARPTRPARRRRR